MTGSASLTVRRAENRIWGPHVFLEATGDPEAIRESGNATVARNWRVTNLVASRFWAALGFRIAELRLTRELPG
jgi:hypothetical protein